MEARFPAPVKTGTVALPASYSVANGSFSGEKRKGYDVNHPTYVALSLKKEYIYISTLAMFLHGRRNLRFYCKRGVNEIFHSFLFSISKLSRG